MDVGFDEYDIAIQQNINLEIMNHEKSPVTFLNSKQLYGNCGNVPDKAKGWFEKFNQYLCASSPDF